MKNPHTRSCFYQSKCQPQNLFSIFSCSILQVARPVSWTEPQFTDNVKIEHVMARLVSRLIQIMNGTIQFLIDKNSWIVSSAPCQAPTWVWESTWWSTRLLTRPRTRRSASSPSLSSSSSKSTPAESVFCFQTWLREKLVSCVPLFIHRGHICFYRWVLCRVGNTGRQIRLLVPKVIKVVISSTKIFTTLFFRRFLQAVDLSTSALAHREVWKAYYTFQTVGNHLQKCQLLIFCCSSQYLGLEVNPMSSPWTKKPWQPGFDFQYNALCLILQ